jgi:3-oxoacyl-(acyl-carrier-protein) synthase
MTSEQLHDIIFKNFLAFKDFIISINTQVKYLLVLSSNKNNILLSNSEMYKFTDQINHDSSLLQIKTLYIDNASITSHSDLDTISLLLLNELNSFARDVCQVLVDNSNTRYSTCVIKSDFASLEIEDSNSSEPFDDISEFDELTEFNDITDLNEIDDSANVEDSSVSEDETAFEESEDDVDSDEPDLSDFDGDDTDLDDINMSELDADSDELDNLDMDDSDLDELEDLNMDDSDLDELEDLDMDDSDLDELEDLDMDDSDLDELEDLDMDDSDLDELEDLDMDDSDLDELEDLDMDDSDLDELEDLDMDDSDLDELDEEAPAEEAPVEEAPVEETPVEETPVEEAPVEEAPVEEAPVEEAPVEEAPVEEAPAEEAPVEEAPVEEAPVEEAPVEEAPVEEAPVEEAPVEEAPVEVTTIPKTTDGLVNSFDDDYAIIGIDGVFPNSSDINALWNNIHDKVDLFMEIPNSRWNHSNYQTNSKYAGFIKNTVQFDNTFFNISDEEAQNLNPVQRLLLESIWKTIESAGYLESSITKNIGMFIGSDQNEFINYLLGNNLEANSHTLDSISIYQVIQKVASYYKFNGPIEAVNADWTSSMLAISRAIDELRKGSCSMAMVSGINVILSPKKSMLMEGNDLLASDFQMKPFDESSEGFVRSETLVTMLIKPLSQAIEDKDPIHAVIKSISVSHNLCTKESDGTKEAEVIKTAWKKGNIDPSKIKYIETSSVGIKSYDTLEVNALEKAFLETELENKVKLGNIQSYIGNVENASSLASLLNILTSMKKKTFLGVKNFKNISSDITCEKLDLTSKNISIEGSETNAKLYAGVNSISPNGIVSHMIVESPPEIETSENEDEEYLFVLSAKTTEDLNNYASAFITYLKNNAVEDGATLRDISYTLQLGREKLDERLAIIANGLEDLISKLIQYVQNPSNALNIYCGNSESSQDMLYPIFDGSEADEFVNLLMINKNYKNLARLWVIGVSLDWNILYDNKIYPRISLPTYQFSGKEFPLIK